MRPQGNHIPVTVFYWLETATLLATCPAPYYYAYLKGHGGGTSGAKTCSGIRMELEVFQT